jgi:GT2 family glycosyltransferase
MRKLVVIVPCFNGVIDVECERGLRELERRGIDVWREPGFSAIDKARSVLASRALHAGYDALMWIDADIVFRPDDVDRFHACGEPFIAGLYAKKGRRELAAHLLPGTQSIQFGQRGGLFEVRYVGTGFLYAAAEVYRRMEAQLPVCDRSFDGRGFVPYFLPAVIEDRDKGAWYLSEDYAFCERARQVGCRIMVDSRVRIGHAGRYVYSWEDAGSSVERFDNYRFDIVPAKS